MKYAILLWGKILSSLSCCHMIAQVSHPINSRYFTETIRTTLSPLEAFLHVHATYL